MTPKIIANKTILENTQTKAIWIAGKSDEETQLQHPSHSHIRPIGQITIPVKDTGEWMMKLYEEIKHGDDEHQQWLKNKIESFIERNCL